MLLKTHQLMQEPMKKRAAAYLLKLAPAAFMGISCTRARATNDKPYVIVSCGLLSVTL